MSQQDQKWDGEPYTGSRQPNFIQKLYECVVTTLGAQIRTNVSFLALDPHPYANTLYWATDGRQLVIAQPDKVGRSALYSPDTDHSSSRRYFPSSSSMTSYRRLAAS